MSLRAESVASVCVSIGGRLGREPQVIPERWPATPFFFSPLSRTRSQMGASDTLFRATCASLGVATLATGAWLAASMFKGYSDASEWEVRERRKSPRFFLFFFVFCFSARTTRLQPPLSHLTHTAPAACRLRRRPTQGRIDPNLSLVFVKECVCMFSHRDAPTLHQHHPPPHPFPLISCILPSKPPPPPPVRPRPRRCGRFEHLLARQADQARPIGQHRRRR
jgi:hypothetical protein